MLLKFSIKTTATVNFCDISMGKTLMKIKVMVVSVIIVRM